MLRETRAHGFELRLGSRWPVVAHEALLAQVPGMGGLRPVPGDPGRSYRVRQGAEMIAPIVSL